MGSYTDAWGSAPPSPPSLVHTGTNPYPHDAAKSPSTPSPTNLTVREAPCEALLIKTALSLWGWAPLWHHNSGECTTPHWYVRSQGAPTPVIVARVCICLLGNQWRLVLRRRRWRFVRPFGAGFSQPSGAGGTVSAVRLSCGVTGGAAGGERRGGVVGTVVSAVPALPSEAAEAAEAAEAVEASFEELLPLPAAPASPTPAAETAKAAEATAPLPAAPAPPSPAAEAAERDEAPAPLPAAPAPFSPVAVVAEAAETPAPSPAVPVPPPPAAEVAEVAGAAETAGAGRDATLRPMER